MPNTQMTLSGRPKRPETFSTVMHSFWPTEHGHTHSPQLAERMNGHVKLVAWPNGVDADDQRCALPGGMVGL
jgi:hypothetical protein